MVTARPAGGPPSTTRKRPEPRAKSVECCGVLARLSFVRSIVMASSGLLLEIERLNNREGHILPPLLPNRPTLGFCCQWHYPQREVHDTRHSSQRFIT